MPIKVVLWDVDGVWYYGISTGHAVERSSVDPIPVLHHGLEERWFSQEDVDRWKEEYNREIVSATDLSQMLYDMYYTMQRDGQPLIKREHIVQGRQALLKGMTMKQVREVADSVPRNPGLDYAVDVFRRNSLYQTAFSDGLGPFVLYLMRKMGMDYGETVPAIVSFEGREMLFESRMADNVILTGKVQGFDKAQAAFNHLTSQGHQLNEVAAIDDSGSNVETILAPVYNAGGVAVGYNPTDAHRPIFQKYSIPVIKGKDLRGFAEIVLNPREATIAKYCE